MKVIVGLGLLFASLLMANAASAQTCTETWDYRIVNLEDPEALTRTARRRSDAARGLNDALNALGGRGWELMSNHEVVESQLLPPPGLSTEQRAAFNSDWTYHLKPQTALFKRKREECVE